MIMASFMCKILTSIIIVCIALQEGCGLPLSERAELPAQAPQKAHVRTKRCSCNSWDDKECIYFCHLDIIWVNTPSKLLPYGLGSPLSRRRRSADRCRCLNPADKTCSGFCQKSSQNIKTDAVGSAGKSENINLLTFFRSLVKSNVAIAKEFLSNKKVAQVNRLKNRTRR